MGYLYEMRKESRRGRAGSLPPLGGPAHSWTQQSVGHRTVKQVIEVLRDPTAAVKSWLKKLLAQST
jgi:hypothetical protein